MTRHFMDGNEAVAWGAMHAGCRFFAGYPITPATSILNTMLRLLPPAGGVCMQGEDEIASIGYCLGASMAGLKAMTATSGPGISLYSEQISFAVGSEIPIVIIDVQRLGPSTGSATKGADGDIQFLQWGSSGGLPVIVLAPTDARDCFELTVQAFNLSETYRCPVFVASNKEIAQTRESVDLSGLDEIEVTNRAAHHSDWPFFPFAVAEPENVPRFLPIGHEIPVRQTSSTHGVDGYITTDPEEIRIGVERLRDKLLTEREAFTFHEFYGAEGAETLIIAYGVTARAAKSVYNALKGTDRPVALLVLKTLWPVPDRLIRRHAANFGAVFVPEMNLGQYVLEIERALLNKEIRFFGQMNGNLITPRQIAERIGS